MPMVHASTGSPSFLDPCVNCKPEERLWASHTHTAPATTGLNRKLPSSLISAGVEGTQWVPRKTFADMWAHTDIASLTPAPAGLLCLGHGLHRQQGNRWGGDPCVVATQLHVETPSPDAKAICCGVCQGTQPSWSKQVYQLQGRPAGTSLVTTAGHGMGLPFLHKQDGQWILG